MRFISLCAAMILVASCSAPAHRSEEMAENASESAAPGAPDPEYGPAAEGAEAAAGAEAAGPAEPATGSDAAEGAEPVRDGAGSEPGAALPGVRLPPTTDDGAAADLAFCAPVRRRLSAADCQAITDQQASLESGIAAFKPPPTMVRGQVERVRFAIGSESDRATTVRAAGGDGDGGVVPVKIGRFMTATLSGANFKITPIGDPGRDLGASSSELWEWDVEPQREGNHVLQVRVETFAESDDGERTRLSLYRSPPIAVAVVVSSRDQRLDRVRDFEEETTVWQRLVEALTGWFGAAAALVLAISLLVWRLRSFGRRPEADSDAEAGAGEPDGEGDVVDDPPPPQS